MTFENRQMVILEKAAHEALALPVKESGLWFHDDLRTNLYYGVHLYIAAAQGCKLRSPLSPELAMEFAEGMLLRVLQMQRNEPQDHMYGHWPLSLGDDHPEQAQAHPLPVELVGNLLILFRVKFDHLLTPRLREALDQAAVVIYKSGICEIEQKHFYHHETKLICLRLNLGVYFRDEDWIASGIRQITIILERLKTRGFQEYGILPWFWHWIQAVTCAWELTKERPEEHEVVNELLEWLWSWRADRHLKGAWIGPRSRGHEVDSPSDRNVLFDYIQFGDCACPKEIVRLEGAAIISYKVPEEVKHRAVSRETDERWGRIPRPPEHEELEPLHEYVFRTPHYANGGVLEYVREYDNEQTRFQITLPYQPEGSPNQIYFFHPGQGYSSGDPRHASGCGEILLYRHLAAILFNIPDGEEDQIIGSLPFGKWKASDRLWLGEKEDLYMIVHLMNPAAAEINKKGICLLSSGNQNGVIIEMLTKEEALLRHITSLEQLESVLIDSRPVFNRENNDLRVFYSSLSGDEIVLAAGGEGGVSRILNGSPLRIE